MVKKTLWALVLRDTFIDTLHLFYSEGAEEAEEQAKDLEVMHGGKRVSLQNWPRGFKLVTAEVAGTI